MVQLSSIRKFVSASRKTKESAFSDDESKDNKLV